MPRTTFAGHALHPQFVAGPLSLFPMSLLFDFLYAVTRDDAHLRAAFTTLAAGYVNAIAAAAAGFGDYQAIREPKSKRTATTHLALNIGVLALTGGSLLLRLRRRSDSLAIALNAAGNSLMVVSAWYGGELVYEHGLRVSGRQQLTADGEIQPPRDDLISGLIRRAGSLAERIYR